MSQNNKKHFLNKELSVGKAMNKYPTKTKINLVHNVSEKENKNAIKWFAVFVVVLGIFTKFAIIEPMQEIKQAQMLYEKEVQSLNVLKENNEEYNAIKSEYEMVSEWYLREDEILQPNKLDVFAMVEEDVIGKMEVRSIRVDGSSIVVNTEKTTIAKVSEVLRLMQNDHRNRYCSVTTTSCEQSGNENDVYATFVIEYGEKVVEEVNGGQE